MTDTISLGSVTLALLHDGHTELEGDQVFFPAEREAWSALTPSTGEGLVRAAVRGLLVSYGGGHTLIDTGYGEEGPPGRSGALPANLAATGVQPKQVSRVILTHAHGDHCMGNTLRRDGRWLPSFPLAEYVIQQREVEWLRDQASEMWITRFQPLQERGQLRIIDSTTALDETLTCWKTPGHTAGHQSVRIHTPEGDALFLGDLVILAANFRHPEWGPGWAWSHKTDAESRREVAAWAADSGALLMVGHDPEYPSVRLERDGQEYRIMPITT
ncbi:MAG: MBL fold metallo-hydrolase [Anaerolineae bacterium]|nr:MBL fold metallo-hydrolase [Anaerolineae bacterium]